MMIQKCVLIYECSGVENVLQFNLGKDIQNEHIEVKVKSKMDTDLRLVLNIIPKQEITIKNIFIEGNIQYEKDDKIFVNGFETWTNSREFDINENIPPLHNILWTTMRSQGDYGFYNYIGKKGVIHGYTYSYLRTKDESFTLFGSLSEDSGYTIFEHVVEENVLRVIKECKGLVINKKYEAFNLFICSGTEEEVIEKYFNAVGLPKMESKPCSGWTSWYNYYTNINEDIIIDNLDAFYNRKVPIDVFQIDDGYQKSVGDWLEANNKFPKGMKCIAHKIKEKGYKAGLWVAPFICEKNSDIFKFHRDWILRDEDGELVKAGYNSLWSGEYFTLDFYNEEVRKYLKQVFSKIFDEWNFDMVKLDFLYAIAVTPTKYKTRGTIMAEGMEFLRELCKDKIILGCGVPLSSAFGRVEYCRIGSDIALTWEDNIFKKLNFRERNSTINSLTSTIGRRHLNGKAFCNDPDVFILRAKNNKMNKEQRYSLFLLNLIFGALVFTSDNINEYSKNELEIYYSHFPMKDKKINKVDKKDNCYIIDFDVEDRHYIVLSNLSGKKMMTEIPQGIYFSSKSKNFISSSTVCLKPYESICLLKVGMENYTVAGSTGHIFPGCEIENLEIKDKEVNLVIDQKCMCNGEVYIRIPNDLYECRVNGQIIKTEKVEGLALVKVNYGVR